MAGSRMQGADPFDAIDSFMGQLETDVRELSTSDQRFGADSVVFALSGSAQWTGTLPASPQDPLRGRKILRVTATGASMDGLFGDLLTWPLYVGTDVLGPGDYLEALDNDETAYFVESSDDAVDMNQRNTKRWLVVLSGDTTTPVSVDLRMIASDAVSVLVQEVN